jgi:RimJ/RimL family protein N-acetyltransferase
MPSSPSFVQVPLRGPVDWEQAMFPEIFRDEVFRLETRRLWLRWPVRGDINDPAAPLTRQGVGTDGSEEKLDNARLAAWHAAMADGAALHLVLALKADQSPLGILHLVPNGLGTLTLDGHLNAAHRGHGYMTEAVQAAAHAAFRLARVSAIEASPAVDNGEGRGVLQHCGFTYAGSGMKRSRSGRVLEPCDHFRLDHATWSSLQGWVMPGFGAYTTNGTASSSSVVQPMVL